MSEASAIFQLVHEVALSDVVMDAPVVSATAATLLGEVVVEVGQSSGGVGKAKTKSKKVMLKPDSVLK